MLSCASVSPKASWKRVGKGVSRPRDACAPGLQFQGHTLGGPSRHPAVTKCRPRPAMPAADTRWRQRAAPRLPEREGPPPRHGTRCLCPRPDAPSREFTPLIAAWCPLHAAVTQPAVSSASPAPSRQAKPVGSGWERSSGKRRRQRQGQRGAAPRSLHCSGPRRPLWEWAWPGTLGSTF